MIDEPYRILLSHDGRDFIAQVLELPACHGRGPTYAAALSNVQQAISARIGDSGGRDVNGHDRALSTAKTRKPPHRRHVAPVKARLFEQFGLLSNRDLAARIGLVARDAPVMLANALGGRGSRGVRCMIALTLGELPSEIWPDRASGINHDDDDEYRRLTFSQTD